MTYEHNLRRLFLPPIESLPIEEQLTRYKQRDFMPSHLYRIGTHLFGGSAFNVRRRVIDAGQFSPPSGVGHHVYLNASLDGKTYEQSDKAEDNDKMVSEPSVKLSDTESEYKKWLADRKNIRRDLDGLGANEKWLTSKERTPLEAALLTKLRNESKNKDTMKTNLDIEISEVPSVSAEKASKSPDPKKALQKFKRQILKEMTALQQFLDVNRMRLVSLLMTIDKAHTRFISVSVMLGVMNKLKAPLSQAAIEILLQVLDIREDGLLDYQQLINGCVLRAVEEHFKRLEEELIVEEVDEVLPASSEDLWKMKTADLEKKHSNPSTLTGKHGVMVQDYKQEEIKQFSKLIEYCKENGIVLNWQVAERALLIPPDRPKQECLTELRQAGLALLSQHFAESPQEKAMRGQSTPYEGFGKAYKELRGRKKPTFMRLSTGSARIKPLTDCWLTFSEYLKLTEHIRSRPGFKYKDHGLPDNNAFWPGALLDKLRLWMPEETLLDKPCSLYNVFQPVQHTKIYNTHSPMVEQKMAWPENMSGYVQFGSQDRKQYQL